MVRTCNQVLAASFDPETWTADYDDFIAEQLFQLCTPYVSLKDPRDFHDLLHQVAKNCVRKSNYMLSAYRVKKRVHELRNRFYAFERFITYPGVKFNIFTSKFSIDGQYWENLQQQKVRLSIV